MSKSIYVGNLPWAATEEQVQDLFAEYGKVLSVKLVSDRETGRARGFGFVEMEDGEAQAAIDYFFTSFARPYFVLAQLLIHIFLAQTALCSRFLPISTAGFFAQHHPHNRSGCRWHPPHGGTG